MFAPIIQTNHIYPLTNFLFGGISATNDGYTQDSYQ